MELALEPVPIEPAGAVDLVAAARRGDRDAFARLVGPELSTALGASQVVTRSHADAADAVQDALVSRLAGTRGAA